MTVNYIEVEKLKPHSKNGEYFADITGEKYEEIKRSIKINGMRDPIKILTDCTIIAGHQRYRIAKELGMKVVPYETLLLDELQAEYLLIADNEERRAPDENPILKSARAKFLKEYWGVKNGRNQYSRVNQNGEPSSVDLKSMADIAAAVGSNPAHVNRLLRLNDLIPPLKRLVAIKALSQAQAEPLAYLSEEDQQRIYDALGEDVVKRTSKDLIALRKEVEQRERKLEKARKEFAGQRDKMLEVAKKTDLDMMFIQDTIATNQLLKKQIGEIELDAKLHVERREFGKLRVRLERDNKRLRTALEEEQQKTLEELLAGDGQPWPNSYEKLMERLTKGNAALAKVLDHEDHYIEVKAATVSRLTDLAEQIPAQVQRVIIPEEVLRDEEVQQALQQMKVAITQTLSEIGRKYEVAVAVANEE
ncbi:MAG: ParB/RepB/Spo0J family partition protein [Bacilli bacterium]